MVLGAVIAAVALMWGLNILSYRILKMRIVRRQRWDLNICCGRTDGGGVNADIVRHADVPRLVIVDVYHLPFRDGALGSVLCSHTLEHVDDPDAFFQELGRVGRSVTVVVPPLWDISAALNLLEHRWLFLTLRKEHHALPRHLPLPLARTVQRYLGQRLHA